MFRSVKYLTYTINVTCILVYLINIFWVTAESKSNPAVTSCVAAGNKQQLHECYNRADMHS